MGFLQRILRNSPNGNAADPYAAGSFETLSDDELRTHMGIKTYGAFELTDAIRPSYDLQIVPKQGFRKDKYVDEASGQTTPVVMAAASKERLLDLFFSLIQPLGPVVDVVLETSHRSEDSHEDLYREHIDLPVLESTLLEFEDVLLNDGCTGIAVINPNKKREVQFDEHKLLIAYGEETAEFEKILIQGDVYPDQDIRFITEAEHVHSSSERLYRSFGQMMTRLGMDSVSTEGEDAAGAW
ncbi:MAG: hypothetical protein AAF664_08790 [Planctomycetota bacterium]